MQIKPSPEKPALHLHLNDPGVSVHFAFSSQGLSRHSFLSKNINVCEIFNVYFW